MSLLEPFHSACSNRHTVNVADRVKRLRAALDLTQQQVADRSRDQINQGTLAKVEGGVNKLTGAKAREGLALAFGVSVDDLGAYLAGDLDIPAILARRHGSAPTAPRELRVEREAQHVSADDETPEERALLRVMDPSKYTMRDLDTARACLRGHHRKAVPDGELDGMARDILRAAHAQRTEGEPTDTESVLRRALFGRHTQTAVAIEQLADDEEAEAAARLRARGYEPGQGREELDALVNAQREKRARREG